VWWFKLIALYISLTNGFNYSVHNQRKNHYNCNTFGHHLYNTPES